ncbi:MAG: hypothetical protein ACYTEL_14815 [Planctomycetota bacterium]|jgi:hypothetical protein
MSGKYSGENAQCSTVLLVLLVSFLVVTLAGCESGPSKQFDIDAAISKDLPCAARLVAHSRTAGAPLLFQAPSKGQVYYVANGDMVATVLVNNEDEIRLNSFSPTQEPYGKPWTELTVDADVVYKAQHTRMGDNRLYFLAAEDAEVSGN